MLLSSLKTVERAVIATRFCPLSAKQIYGAEKSMSLLSSRAIFGVGIATPFHVATTTPCWESAIGAGKHASSLLSGHDDAFGGQRRDFLPPGQ